MPIIYIGTASNTTEYIQNVTLPAHQAGDLIICVAGYNANFPAAPPGFTVLYSVGGIGHYLTVAYIKATSSSTTVSGWSNIQWLSATIYRNANIGNSNYLNTTSNNTTLTYPAVSFINTNNTSWAFGGVAMAQPTAYTASDIPTFWTSLAFKSNPAHSDALSVSAADFVMNGFSGQSFPLSTASTWTSFVTELVYSQDTSATLTSVSGVGTVGTVTPSISKTTELTGVSGSVAVGNTTVFIGQPNLVLVLGVQTEGETGNLDVNSDNSVVISGNTMTGVVGTVTVPTTLVGVSAQLPNPFAVVTIWDKIITSGNV